MADECTLRRIPERQCAECPWRKDGPRGLFPPERFEHMRVCEEPDGPLFACHKSPQGREVVCAGWMDHQIGPEGQNINLRLLRVREQPIEHPRLRGETYGSYAAMEAAHREMWDALQEMGDDPTADKRTWLQCYCCGEDIIESDENGLFYDGQEAVCPGCGIVSWVSIDEAWDEDGEEIGCANVSSHEEAADVGQPRCDGSCDIHPDFVGKPCQLDYCERSKGFTPLVELTVETLPDLTLGGNDR